MSETKKCTKCLLIKNYSSFGKDNSKKIKLKCWCKECETKNQRERRKKEKENDFEKYNLRWKIYYEKHKVHMREVQKEYLSNPENRKKRNQYIKKYKTEKRETDKNFVLYENLRKRIWKCVKNKSNSSKEILGCDIDLYYKWITFTLKDKMNWENYGTYWNIDHLIPINTFDLTNPEEVKNAFNWKNTWAMLSSENFSKKNNIIKEQIDQHQKLLINFLDLNNINENAVISIQYSSKEEEGSETR